MSRMARSGHYELRNGITQQELDAMDAVAAVLGALAAEATKLRAVMRSMHGIEAPMKYGEGYS